MPSVGTTLFCDFDGPIVDVSDRYYTTYQMGLEYVRQNCLETGETSLHCLSKAQFWAFKQNRVPDRQIAYWSGLAEEHIELFLKRVSQLVNQSELLHQDRLQAGARLALKLFRCYGIRLVLVTLRPPEQVQQFLADHHLNWAITSLYGMSTQEAAYLNQANHKIERLREAISEQNRLGYDTRSAWMIGDTEADIMAGQAAGVSTIALTCGIRSSQYLKSFRPTQLLPDLQAASQYLTYVQAACSHR